MSKTKIEQGTMWVASHYGEHHLEKGTELLVKTFDEGAPIARVKVSLGLTVQLAPYQFARVDVSVELPCHVEELEGAKKAAAEFAGKAVEEEVTAALQFGRDLVG